MSNVIRVSTRDFVRREETDEEGVLEPVRYRGDLHEEQAIAYTRQLAFWPWGGADGSLASGEITLDNRGGRYDQLVFRDMRDQEITVDIPTAMGGSIRALTAIVDRVDAPSDRDVSVLLKDRLSLLDVPLQTQVYDDSADDGAIDRPLPITLGVVRSVRPTMWEAEPEDEDGPAFRIHDGPISGLTNVRAKGVILSPFDSPPGFKLDARIGNAGVIAGADPQGVFTVDASTSGDAIIPPAAEDVLGGSGDFSEPFTTATFTDPKVVDGWWFYGANGSATEPNHTPRLEYESWGGGRARIIGGYTQVGRAIITAADENNDPVRVLEAGKTYRWTFQQFTKVGFATLSGGTIASQGRFIIRAVDSVVTDDRAFTGATLFRRDTYGADNEPGVYSGTYTVPTWGDRYVQVAVFNGGTVAFGRLEFEEIPPPPPDDLEGITLKDYAIEVIRRVGLPDDSLVTSDLDTVDPGLEPIGFYADRPITALAALRAPLDSFGADVYTDRSGRYRFAKLRDPEVEIPSLIVDANNIVRESDVLVRPDEAKGLTTSMLAGRNWFVFRNSDFGEEAGLSLGDREALMREGRFIRTAVLPEDAEEATGTGGSTGPDRFPRLYRHAVNAEPLLSLFDEAASAKAEIQRMVDLYSVVRRFIEVDIWLDPGQFVDLDEVVLFRYPRYDFTEGRNMLVVGVTDVVEAGGRRRAASLLLWG